MKNIPFHYILALFVLSVFLSLTYTSVAKATIEKDSFKTNTTNEISAPHSSHRLLYTLNADDGFLKKAKGQHYLLTLKGLHEKVVFKIKKIADIKNSGTLSSGKFISLWLDKAGNNIVNADVTGVQINHKTIGHTQFYASVLLSGPHYNKKENELSFDLLDEKSAINAPADAEFHNVTIFVDGCDIGDFRVSDATTRENPDVTDACGLD
jgi:hypothetical protein